MIRFNNVKHIEVDSTVFALQVFSLNPALVFILFFVLRLALVVSMCFCDSFTVTSFAGISRERSPVQPGNYLLRNSSNSLNPGSWVVSRCGCNEQIDNSSIGLRR